MNPIDPKHFVEVTTVIATRDRARLLPRALAAALGQREVAHEVIVVDDGSRDGTPQLLKRYTPRGVRILRHAEPQGVAAARNYGLAETRGRWTAFLDDDDVWSPEKLRRQIDAANKAGAGWVLGAAVNVDEHLRVIDLSVAPSPDRLLETLLADNEVPGGCSGVLARTDILRSLGGFDERFSVLADWDLWIRLAASAPAAAVAEPLLGYVEHGENMHLAQMGKTLHELRRLSEKHRHRSEAAQVDLAARHHLWRAFMHHWSGHRGRATLGMVRIAFTRRRREDAVNLFGAVAGRQWTESRRRERAERENVMEPAWLRELRGCGGEPGA